MLETKKALIVLAQKGRIDELLVPKIIEERLKQKFGTNNTYFLMPLSGPSANPKKYFAHLGQQLKLPDIINDHSDLEMALERRLEYDRSLFLFIRHLEKGNDARAYELARMLRKLLEMTNLQVLLLGDQKLAELRYGNGRLSVLYGVSVKQWPELKIQEVQQLYSDLDLDAETAHTLLKMSGGMPKLLESCCEYFKKRLPISDYSKQLQKSDVLTDAFSPFTDKPIADKQQIYQWLAQEDLGPTESEHHIRNDLLRQLYWSNLLVQRDERLVWRCEVIRQAGRSIFECP